MNHFETSPYFTTLPGVKLADKPFMLEESLVYKTDILPEHPRLELPIGFRSDLASIPAFFRRLFSVAGWWRDAAWPHDFCCDPVDADLNPIPHICDYKQAALIFREAMNDAIDAMDIPDKKKKRPRRTAKFFAWCVKTGGPKFTAGS